MKDRESLKILSLIEEEEESHYRFGLRWFTYMCWKRKKDIREAVEEINGKHGCKLDASIFE